MVSKMALGAKSNRKGQVPGLGATSLLISAIGVILKYRLTVVGVALTLAKSLFDSFPFRFFSTSLTISGIGHSRLVLRMHHQETEARSGNQRD